MGVAMKEIRVRLADELVHEIERRVERGEFHDTAQMVQTALRYYIERHSDSEWEHYVESEIDWSRRHAAS
jgi:Arc/MetJ-type ribon-helix-helix transcriptional regulator